MSILLLLPLSVEEGAGFGPYAIGLTALVLLIGMLMAVLAIGKGREHS